VRFQDHTASLRREGTRSSVPDSEAETRQTSVTHVTLIIRLVSVTY
jgi:hypothetical protein